MKTKLLITLLLGLALMVTACQPGNGDDDRTPTSAAPTFVEPTDMATEVATETMVVGTDTPEMTSTVEATSTSDMLGTGTPGTPGTPAAIATGLMLDSSSGTTSFLTDDQGRAVYVYAQDTQGGTGSACMDDCANTWMPVLVSGTPTAGTGVDATMIGTITRDDGQMQATYNGWPLYYYSGDMAPGDMNGQGMNDEWYLIGPDGTTVQQ
jgi:predicted lipoprotein with Yx(FWY)xxD motif